MLSGRRQLLLVSHHKPTAWHTVNTGDAILHASDPADQSTWQQRLTIRCLGAAIEVAAPVMEVAAPVMEVAAPVVEEVAPIEEAAPIEEVAPVMEASAPVVDEPTPIMAAFEVDGAAPVVEAESLEMDVPVNAFTGTPIVETDKVLESSEVAAESDKDELVADIEEPSAESEATI